MTDQIRLEPEAHAFAEAAANSPLLFTLGPEQGRLVLDQVQSGNVRKPAVDVEELTITDGPSAQVALRILRPQNAQAPLPVILYIHGAGWVFGSPQTHDRLVRELAVGAGAAVVFPVYRLCPEVRYPTALEECYTAARWVGRFGREHGLDAERLAVAGDCVGGNLATVLTLLSRERGEPDIRLQVLFYPVTAEADIVRDEGEAYASKLRQAGVRVTAVRFQGTIHDFVTLNALAHSASAWGAITLATAWLREGFST